MAKSGESHISRGLPGARRAGFMVRFWPNRPSAIEVILDLAPVREALKDQWAKVAPSVRRYAGLVIERHLGEGDSFEQGDDAFVIRMRGVDPGKANRELEQIEHEFYERIFGSQDRVDKVLSGHHGREKTSRRKRFRFYAGWGSRLRKMFTLFRATRTVPGRADVSPVEDRPAPGAGTGKTTTRAPRGRVMPARVQPRSGGEAGADAAASESVPPGAVAAELDRDSVAGAAPDAGPDRKSKTNALERALYQAVLEADRQGETASQKRVFPAPGTLFLYRGSWLVEKGTMPIFTCLPARSVTPFEFVSGEQTIPASAGAPQLTILDNMILEKVVHDLSSHEPTQIWNAICVPVHYESLAGDAGAHYQKVLKNLPAALRDKLTIEIINLSQGTGQRIAHSIIRGLRPYCRTIMGRLNLSDHNFQAWRGLELHAFGVDIECDGRPEAKIIGDLDVFVTAASRHGYRTYVRGAHTRSLAAAIATSGVQYVDGPAIDEGDLALCADPVPFGIADIYADL